MKRFSWIFIFGGLLFSLISAFAHKGDRYWVYFKDKDIHVSPALSSERIAERKRMGISLQEDDLPVSTTYLQRLCCEREISVRHASRWLNAVSVEGEPKAIENLSKLPFVANIVPIQCHPTGVKGISASVKKEKAVSASITLDEAQEKMNVPFLWKKGCKGKGVKIAVFDDGFKGVRNDPKSDQAKWFKKMKINTWYDFAGKQKDVFHTGMHGTYVSALIGGRKGKNKATAFQATFYLARTEDISFERNIEEDNWVAAAEWADSIGIDLIHTSLNYAVFDEGEKRQYANKDKDGKTAVITLAANKAFSKGIMVVCSAGNEGLEGTASIVPPCDGSGTVCVGSIDKEGNLSAFSSKGPTADGRMKPDVVCFGDNLYAFNSYFGDGTSYAAPQISAFLGVVIHKFRTISDEKIKECLILSGNRQASPNPQFGNGLPNGEKFWEELNKAK